MRIKEFDKTAIVYGDELISFPRVIKHVLHFARFLRIKPGERAVIFSENRPEWIYALYAVWQKNGIAIPVDYLMKESELVHILKDSNPNIIFVSKSTKETVEKALTSSGISARTLLLDDLMKSIEETEEKQRSTFGNDATALILYTSGTTGLPKGVALTFGNLDSNIKGIEETGIAGRDDTILALLPFHHTYPLMVNVLLPLALGASVIIAENIKGDEIRRLMKTWGVTIMVGVPRLFELLHNGIFDKIRSSFWGRLFLSISASINSTSISRRIFKGVYDRLGEKVKYLVSGGAKLNASIIRDFGVIGLPVLEGYGLTETSPICTFNRPGDTVPGSVGLPLKDVRIKIENGEVLVRGPNVMKGYWNREDATREVMKDGWFKTGDSGRIDEQGRLFITGRKKELIVLASGKNINPEEVEAEITKCSPFVKETAVMEKDGRLFAFIVPDLKALKSRNITNIYDRLRWDAIDQYNRSAPSYRKVSGFSLTSREFPRTRLGKIKRYLLHEEIHKPPEKKEHPPEPDTHEYQILKEYLKKVTKSDIYFDSHIEIDLGLDSLDKVELLNFLDQSYGLSLSEEDLSRFLVLEELYNRIKLQKTKAEDTVLSWGRILEEDYELPITSHPYFLFFLKFLLYPLFKVFFLLKTQGGNKAVHLNPVIITPNHQSYIDGFLIIASLPMKALKDTYILATEEFFRSSLRQTVARHAHVVTLDINGNLKESLKKAAFLLREGKNIVIFPEGARTRDGSMLPFKKAFAILSRELNIPVLPVVLKGAFEAYPIGQTFPRPGKISVTFLEKIRPGNKDYEEITSETKGKIAKCLEEI